MFSFPTLSTVSDSSIAVDANVSLGIVNQTLTYGNNIYDVKHLCDSTKLKYNGIDISHDDSCHFMTQYHFLFFFVIIEFKGNFSVVAYVWG